MEATASKDPEKEPEEPAQQVEVKDATVLKKKRKKGRRIERAKGFPKFYKNGYVRYCDEVRPIVCSENPGLDPVEVTKLVASKWQSGLTLEEKKPYLDEAKLDKERFKKELKEFNISHPNQEVNESLKLNTKKSKSNKTSSKTKTAPPAPESTQPPQSSSATKVAKEDEVPKAFIGSNCELPIFTDAFLEHNKIIETELKTLRKNKIEFDLQNSVLMKHIENMENGVLKVDAEAAATKQRNEQLEVYLVKLKCILASSFNSLNCPTLQTGASIENIGEYMTGITSPAAASISSKASEIVRKIDLKFTP